ncbi:MAG TPA: NAD-dependent epimerase/dehydratase family protein [Gemmatimonadaceae bacterium]|nr:NAD-dependent epimerase/dehydratase family protein [Gemmatimonadaceae bacterium]
MTGRDRTIPGRASRRDFIRAGAMAGAAAWLSRAGMPRPRHAADPAPFARTPLRILVLGGTGFVGPHLVRYAVARGHRVTIFTRGRHDADLPDAVERLTGDRNGHLESLAGRSWDAAIDDSATNPDWVRQSASLLQAAVGRYLFTSSTGVYYPYRTRGLDESVAPHLDLHDAKDPSETFGVAKAQCERVVTATFGDRGTVVRPTYIVGPGDSSDRFPYWPVRLARGGDVLAPGRADDPVAFIDVRDLAEFMVKLVEDGAGGVFNAVGPRAPLTARAFYEAARDTINPAATLVYVDDYDFLTAQKIDEAIPWVMLKGNDYGHMSIRNGKAVAAGLRFRPMATTLKDTLAWWPSVPDARRANPHFTITADQEAAALAAWRAKGAAGGRRA